MNTKKFLVFSGGSVLTAGGMGYVVLRHDEQQILRLASLAPSGQNAQPWFVKYTAPYQWTICSDKSRWLPEGDPTQRETILAIGAFLQNLEYAANHAGYKCQFHVVGTHNQDEDLVEVRLFKSASAPAFNIRTIESRTTVRSNFLDTPLKKKDADYLFAGEGDHFHFLSAGSKECSYLSEQTIAANRIQSYWNDVEMDLAEWIRFASKSGWTVRKYYTEMPVINPGFGDKNRKTVVEQVTHLAGWLLITSKDNTLNALLETGKRLQRLPLKVRARGIAIHPMSEILQKSKTQQALNSGIGIRNPIQFILRVGYVKNYPPPVTLRRPIDEFVVT